MRENRKIVVIDDESSVQEVVRAYLEKDGYQVFVAGNGADTDPGGWRNGGRGPEHPRTSRGFQGF